MSELILYKKMYLELFRAVTDATSELDAARGGQNGQKLDEAVEKAVISLRKAQQKTEQIYIDG